jgi:hypothetical protein
VERILVKWRGDKVRAQENSCALFDMATVTEDEVGEHMPTPLTAEMVDEYMGPVLEAARGGDLCSSRMCGAT